MWEPRRLSTLWASTACYRDTKLNESLHTQRIRPFISFRFPVSSYTDVSVSLFFSPVTIFVTISSHLVPLTLLIGKHFSSILRKYTFIIVKINYVP
jgi:hypothetical protein